MAKYLVCRNDAIRRNSSTTMIKNSCFPILVETGYGDFHDYGYEEILNMAFKQIASHYRGNRNAQYVIVPMSSAVTINFRPKPPPEYFTDITPFV